MASRVFGDQVTVTTSAQNLTTILSLTDRRFFRQLDIRLTAAGSANTVYGGRSDVTNVPANATFAINTATPVYSYGPFEAPGPNTTDIYLVASADTVVHIEGVE